MTLICYDRNGEDGDSTDDPEVLFRQIGSDGFNHTRPDRMTGMDVRCVMVVPVAAVIDPQALENSGITTA